MLTWLLILQLNGAVFMTVPAIVSEDECMRVGQLLTETISGASGATPVCTAYEKTP